MKKPRSLVWLWAWEGPSVHLHLMVGHLFTVAVTSCFCQQSHLRSCCRRWPCRSSRSPAAPATTLQPPSFRCISFHERGLIIKSCGSWVGESVAGFRGSIPRVAHFSFTHYVVTLVHSRLDRFVAVGGLVQDHTLVRCVGLGRVPWRDIGEDLLFLCDGLQHRKDAVQQALSTPRPVNDELRRLQSRGVRRGDRGENHRGLGFRGFGV